MKAGIKVLWTIKKVRRKAKMKRTTVLIGIIGALLLVGLGSSLPAQTMAPAYYIAVNGTQTGPHTLDALKQMAQSGSLAKDAFVWKAGMPEWAKAGTIPEIATLFAPGQSANAPGRGAAVLELWNGFTSGMSKSEVIALAGKKLNLSEQSHEMNVTEDAKPMPLDFSNSSMNRIMKPDVIVACHSQENVYLQLNLGDSGQPFFSLICIFIL
jgi:hypothetical protein